MNSSLPDLPVEAQIADPKDAGPQHSRARTLLPCTLPGGRIRAHHLGGRERLQVVPRNAWFDSLEDYEIAEAAVDQYYVRAYGDVAAVMLWRQKASLRGADRSAQFTLTDIWVKRANGWRLAERHSSRRSTPAQPGHRQTRWNASCASRKRDSASFGAPFRPRQARPGCLRNHRHVCCPRNRARRSFACLAASCSGCLLAL